ncbi:MAG TPA: oxidoreductase [Flavisolibacter sp.]|nr:oxidoreductase [Flavisolibacter sp.]
MKSLLCLLFISVMLPSRAQQIRSIPTVELLSSGTKSSLRGLSVVNDEVLWVSGSNGTVGRSSNGGKDWKWMVVKGFEKRDFRDIEAFDATTALIMAVGEPAYILRTVDGGDSWKVVYENKNKGMFLDAMEFWNEQAGIVIGDPIDGRFFITRSFDGGNTWQDVPQMNRPEADSGEACFAASGTNVRALDNDEAVFISGGLRSRAFIRDSKISLPIVQGRETTGANSIAVWDRYRRKGGNQLVIVGGDFSADTVANQNCFYSTDRGKTWKAPKTPPHGYRSCVEYLDKRVLVSCGLSGVDYSIDNAANWKLISPESFHVCRIAKIGTTVYLAGSNGKVAKLVYSGKRK